EVFENVGAWSFQPLSVAEGDRSERIIGMLVSANFFQTYGARPTLGRAFLPGTEDRDPGAHPVAILGHGYWESRFGADPGVVGTTVTLNGHPFEIVGVAPPDFKGPVNFAAPPVFVPFMMQHVLEPGFDRINSRGSNSATAVARLRASVTVPQAEERLAAVLARLKEELPDQYDEQLRTTIVPQVGSGIHPSFRSAQVGMSSVIMTVVSLLLLVACVNVANLFLARASERRREMGIRLSIGAGRGRIIRQLLTESLVFSVLAGAAGLLLAWVAVGLLGAIRPPMDGPWEFSVGLNRTVLLFTGGISILAGFLFGLAPALQATNPDTVAAVKGESDQAGGRSRASRALVVVQMALSLILLISSGLFLRSLQGATQIDPGFDEPGNLALLSIDPELQGYSEGDSRVFHDRLIERVAALPGVVSASGGDWLPLGLNTSDRGVSVPGYEYTEGELRSFLYGNVREGYVETLGMDLVEGRTFTAQDDEGGPPVIIVNRRFAERFWPGESAVGKIVETAGAEREVIGVVETGKSRSLGEDPTEFMLLPLRERFSPYVTVLARTAGDPGPVLQQIQGIVRELDPGMPVFDVRTMEDHMGLALMPARLGGSVLGLFGILGLVLAAVGIYGVMAYSVARRTREIGIRVALGADRGRVLSLVLRDGMRLALIGTVLGLVGAAAASQLVRGLLYNVSALDPAAFLGVPAVLLAVAALAVYVPARRASGVDPIGALRGH
ncbi:MAG: ABC transporter permease, partial [Gemmatimonadota bacterium]|nr:ABC transporter permease [Gemmatimonadota bacterium]